MLQQLLGGELRSEVGLCLPGNRRRQQPTLDSQAAQAASRQPGHERKAEVRGRSSTHPRLLGTGVKGLKSTWRVYYLAIGAWPNVLRRRRPFAGPSSGRM